MEELIHTIPKNSTLESSQDYELLKTRGIEHIQKLGSKIWTDYNAHDPGITLLELLSYAITDLGYRTGFEMKDILAPENGDLSVFDQMFHKAAKIFPCNQVTITDLRKILIDIDGIRNAWIRPSDKFETTYFVNFNNSTLTETQPGTDIISMEVDQLKGLYDVVIEFDRNIIRKGETLKENAVWKQAKKEVHKHRNLCEDFFSNGFIVKKPDGCEEIKIFADIDVLPNSDNEAIFAEILIRLEQFFSPTVTYYSMQELFDKGLRSDQIFEGPLLKHGFILDEELKAIQRPEVIHTSDLYNIIMDIEGITAVRNLSVSNYLNTGCAPGGVGVVQTSPPEKWCLELYNKVNPSSPLDLDLILKADVPADIADIRFFKGDKDIPVSINTNLVFSKLEVLRLSDKKRRERLQNEVFDLEIPLGDYRELEDYYPVQNELPLTYGTGEEGLAATVSDERKAQAKQLKSFLMFFEQLLANYLSQLNHVRELFSWDDQTDKTYFSQLVQDVKDIKDLYVPDYTDEEGNTINLVVAGVLQEATLEGVIQKDTESPGVFFDRRNRFLNHLIARFNELFTEYSLVMMGIGKEEDLIPDKAHFLADYDSISHGRGKGFDLTKIQPVPDSLDEDDYKTDVWDTENISGYQFRVSRFLGIENIKRRFLYSGHDFSIESKMVGLTTEVFFFTMRIGFSGGEIMLTGDLKTTDDDAFDLFNEMLTDSQTMDYTDVGSGPYSFEIYKDASPVLFASSQDFDTALERDNAKNYLQTVYFNPANIDILTGYRKDTEDGLHVIEHILLRPKNDDYGFLPVSTEPTDTILTTQYENVVIDKGNLDSSYGVVPTGNQGISLYEILLSGMQVHLYDIVSTDPEADFVLLKIFAADFGGYTLKSDGGVPAAFYFYVSDVTTGNKLGESVRFVSEADRNEALLKMLAYYAGLKNGSLGTCSATVDPYSYRATVVLPSWTTRAKDFNYRKLAEKIIRLEAPAHVSLDVVWINQEQMLELEICYRKFLTETAKTDPNEEEFISNPANLVELVARANCTMDKIKNLQDAFAAVYDIKPFLNEEYFRNPIPLKIGHIFADVTDPSGAAIVKAEIIGGDPLPVFIDIHGDTGTNSINTKYLIGGAFDVGDIVLVSSYPGTLTDRQNNPSYVDGVVPGTWTILIETTNAQDNVSCSEITITIEAEFEAVWTIEPAKHQNCYTTNDLLASVYDSNSPEGIPSATLVAPDTLPPYLALNESSGFIPAYDPGTDDSLVGDIIVVDPVALKAAVDAAIGPLTFIVKIKTVDATLGSTVSQVKLVIEYDLSLTADTSFNCRHIDRYSDTDPAPHPNSTDIVRITDTDGIDTINILTPALINPSLAFLNGIGIDLFIEGPLSTHGDPIHAYFRVVNHAVLKAYIDTLTNPNTFPVLLEVTDGCGYVENIQVNLCIKPDTEAVAVVIPVQHINSFNTGTIVATITDIDNGVVSVVPQPNQSVFDDAGLYVTYSGNAAYIRVLDKALFEAAATNGTFTPTIINSLAGYTYSFDVITTDGYGGTSDLTLTIQMYKDREAVYVFAYPSGTSILAYWNFPVHENNNDNIHKNAPFNEVKIKMSDFMIQGQTVSAFGAPVLFDSNNPIVATVTDPDGPIIAAEELFDLVAFDPGDTYYKLGSETATIAFPLLPVYSTPLAHWGAMLNPITGTISVGLNAVQMSKAFATHGVGSHYHRIKTTDVFGGVTIHDLVIVIQDDLPAVYVASGAYPRSFDKYSAGEIIKSPQDPNGRIISATIKSGTIPPGTEFDRITGEIRVQTAKVILQESAPDSISFSVGETIGVIGMPVEEMAQKKSLPASTESQAPAQSQLVPGTWNFTVRTVDEFGGVTDDIPVSVTLLPKASTGTTVVIKDKGIFLGTLTAKYTTVLAKKAPAEELGPIKGVSL